MNIELEKKIFQDKENGIPDQTIGNRYGVNLKQIEKIVVKYKGVNINSVQKKRNVKLLQPLNFHVEDKSVWSFKNRGNWATHNGNYRGNWSPYIPRNVISLYSKANQVVLDYFCGAGTTGVEAKLLGRQCILSDINNNALLLAKNNLDFQLNHSLFDKQNIYEPLLVLGDARDLMIKDESIDLICAHPPYANIIQYTESNPDDLSHLAMEEFINEMMVVAKESFRVLKSGHKCAILIGDLRRNKYVVPLGFHVIEIFLKAGFVLRDLIIKRQHNCKTTGFWYKNSMKYNFLLLAHEYLPIFEKPMNIRAIKEVAQIDYLVNQHILEIDRRKTNLDLVESTTVWILENDKISQQLITNLKYRYSKKGVVYYINESDIQKKDLNGDLVIISTDYLINQPLFDIPRIINNLVNDVLCKNKPLKFISIILMDQKVGELTEPLAQRVFFQLAENKSIKLKEIVIVLPNLISNALTTEIPKCIEIIHKYVLIYEVLK